MSIKEFKAINTQEEFDTAIQQRLDRERAKYSDYEALKTKAAELDTLKTKEAGYQAEIAKAAAKYSDLEQQLNNANTLLESSARSVAELTGRAERAETSLLKAKIAGEYKIPQELAERLNGASEADLRKDAEAIARYISAPAPAPLASKEPAVPPVNSTDAALLQMAAALGG